VLVTKMAQLAVEVLVQALERPEVFAVAQED
jgi:hypothetical protein